MSGPFILLWLLMESILTVVFHFLNTRVFSKKEDDQNGLTLIAVLKGIMERLLLILGLMNGYPHVITAFAALKIGTRINDKEHKISNDYFLIGNLISLLAALAFVLILQTQD
ncbi:MAG: hypothetical protein JJ895_00010 [Balneolaceae bacterium]|nr:hypothetical protein [Balneolaceae bacterium]